MRRLVLAVVICLAVAGTAVAGFSFAGVVGPKTAQKLAVTDVNVSAIEYDFLMTDSSGAKVTRQHYRRFVTPAQVQARALERGFDAEYAVEGFGFAKYQWDDAYVARTVFTKQRVS